MIERLFLNRINLDRGGRCIAKAVEFSAFVYANETESRLPISDMAVPGTKIAMRFVVWLRFPPARFVKLGGFLQDFQIFHGIASTRAALMFIIRYILDSRINGESMRNRDNRACLFGHFASRFEM
jgi:hypothetical protein